MAIIIPSRNIFEKKNNKVLKNAISKVELSLNDVNAVLQNGNSSSSIPIPNLASSSSISKEDLKDDLNQSRRYITGCEVIAYPLYYPLTLVRKKLDNSNYFVTQISPTLEGQYQVSIERCSYISQFDGLPSSGTPRITFEREEINNYNTSYLYQNELVGEYLQSFDSNSSQLQPSCKARLGIKVENNQIVATVKFLSAVDATELYTQEVSISSSQINGELGNVNDKYFPTSITTNETDYNFQLYLRTLRKLEIYLGWDLESYSSITGGLKSRPLDNGLKVTLELKNANLNYGDEIKTIEVLGTVNETLTIDGAIGNEILAIGNDLIRTTNVINTSTEENAKTIYLDTLEKYKHGKETAEILCSISDYYDENGQKVISKDGLPLSQEQQGKMLFDLYDVVIPQVFSTQGNDVPMSVKSDGEPKEFEVVGTKLIFDGRLRQKIFIQEKS